MRRTCPNHSDNPKCSGTINDRRAKSCKSCSKYKTNHPQFRDDIPNGSLQRMCPKCGEEIKCSNRGNMIKAIDGDWWCRKCAREKISRQTSIALVKWKDNPFRKRGVQKQITANRLGFKSYSEYQRSLSAWKRYRTGVWRITKQQPLNVLEHFDERGRAGTDGAYQLDHIVSIHAGFKRNLPTKMIGHISNLKMIPWLDNVKKGVK